MFLNQFFTLNPNLTTDLLFLLFFIWYKEKFYIAAFNVHYALCIQNQTKQSKFDFKLGFSVKNWFRNIQILWCSLKNCTCLCIFKNFLPRYGIFFIFFTISWKLSAIVQKQWQIQILRAKIFLKSDLFIID